MPKKKTPRKVVPTTPEVIPQLESAPVAVVTEHQAHPGGRPTLYRPEYANIAKFLCQRGATDVEIATALSVSVASISLWKKVYEEFSEALKRGKEDADANVERALYERAIGYSHPDTKYFSYEGEIISADTIKYYPPDVAACFIWLKNRKKAEWKDRHTVEHTADESLETIMAAVQERRRGRLELVKGDKVKSA